MQLNTIPDTLSKASLAWTVPCCSVFDWLVGHAGVGASEEYPMIIYTNIQDLILGMIVSPCKLLMRMESSV